MAPAAMRRLKFRVIVEILLLLWRPVSRASAACHVVEASNARSFGSNRAF
jgi:hypothetical protein